MEFDKNTNQFVFDDDDREVFGLGPDRHTWEADRPASLYTLVMAVNNRFQRCLDRGEVHVQEIADELLVHRHMKVIAGAISVLKPHLPEVEVIEYHEQEI